MKKRFEKNNNGKLEKVADAFAETYSVELCMKEKPIIIANKLLENMKKYCGNVELISNQDNNISFAFTDYILEYKNASVPVSIVVSTFDQKPNKERLKRSLEQSWSFKNKESLEECKFTLLVTDIMAIGLEYTKRIKLFQKVLYAIVEIMPCEGIHFHLTEQVLSREEYLENNPLNDDYDLLFGALNVRLFNIEGKENEYLMDTLGLSAVGLCDLQCHFKNLDPNEVSNILYSYGYYIFDNLDVAENMKTIEGVNKGEEWTCQHEVSLAKPERVVLDINPGKEFSSENRI